MMAIMLIFRTYLYAMSYGDPEDAERIKCLDNNFMLTTKYYLTFFTRKPLEMGFLFFYCDSLACFAS